MCILGISVSQLTFILFRGLGIPPASCYIPRMYMCWLNHGIAAEQSPELFLVVHNPSN